MTDQQWQALLDLIDGRPVSPPPVGFLVDGPWLADLSGVGLNDYLTDGQTWLDANLHAVRRFPQVIFFAGFWSEYGMSTNPSAFGAKCVWPEDGFPSPETVLDGYAAIDRLARPNCRTDGLMPFVIKRLALSQARIEAAGHRIRFATSHGPITIASYLLGHTETLVGMRTDPGPIHKLLGLVTDYVVEWLAWQAERFPSVEGILVLEDLMGFLGEDDFGKFALPYMKRIFVSLDVPVKFLHNDAYGLITASHLTEMGVNFFNFSFEHSFDQIRELAGESVTLMGNVPPRDVLAAGSVEDVRRCVREVLRSLGNDRRVILSAGGFLPPGASEEKLAAFLAVSNER